MEDGTVVKIEGRLDSLTNGTLCSKGLSALQHIDNPYRLKYPMKQVGKKGEGKWKRISWEEALDTIEDKLRDAIDNYGPADDRRFPGNRSWLQPLHPPLGT